MVIYHVGDRVTVRRDLPLRGLVAGDEGVVADVHDGALVARVQVRFAGRELGMTPEDIEPAGAATWW